MKFLIDAQLPPALARWLEARGHSAAHVGGGSIPDQEIAGLAEAEGAVLITKDEDFLHLRLPDRFALMWLRCWNVTNPALNDWLEERWDKVEMLIAGGERVIELR